MQATCRLHFTFSWFNPLSFWCGCHGEPSGVASTFRIGTNCSGIETPDIGCDRFSPDSLVVWRVASSQANHAGLTMEQTSWEVSMLPIFYMQFQRPARFCTGMLIILLIRKGVRRCTSHLEQSFSGCLKGCSMHPADSLVIDQPRWPHQNSVGWVYRATR